MKKKIAIITTHPIQYYAPLFRELAKSIDFDFHVFYTKGDTKNYQFDASFGKKINWDIPLLDGYSYTFLENTSKKAEKSGFWSIKNPELIKKIKNYKADAILVFGWNYESHFSAIRYFKGKIPIFFRGDSTLLDVSNFLKSALRTLILKFIYRYIDYAFYVGQSNKHYYLKYGLKEENLFYSSHSIDNQRFDSVSETQKEELKKLKIKLFIKENEKVILFCGKFIDKKNPEFLIKCFLDVNFNDVHLVLVGNGELEISLKNKYQNESKIHFLPFQNQSKMPMIYRLGNVFCLPSKGPGETWGLAVNEAMACGLVAVVSNKCGCAADLIIEGKTGYVFESENKIDLTQKLKKAIVLCSEPAIEQKQKVFIDGWNITKTSTKMIEGFMKIIQK
ncbi:MAG: glycosyltransferase [Bacteroidetes bacterium]|nr:MAG: glycosyltransferase [Bacteroidota bacterium]